MIRLYHGFNADIVNVDLSRGRPFKDFGRGFYLTHIKKQAELMALRTTRIYGGIPIISQFDFDLEAAISDGLKIKQFHHPDLQWARFIMANRNNDDPDREMHQFDIVIGPVADDGVARQLRRFANGWISEDQLVREITFHNLTSQFFFHTPSSLKYLHKL